VVLAQVLSGAILVEGIFAAIYYVMSFGSPGPFGSPLTGIDAAYFTISTATTTGMGDIHPVTAAARLVVTAQMVVSLAVLVTALSVALDRFFAQRVNSDGSD
jgi:Ion channel